MKSNEDLKKLTELIKTGAKIQRKKEILSSALSP